MKMKSTASRPFKYAGLMVQPHAEFSVKSARDAKLLAIMRRAEIVHDLPAAPVVASKPAAKRAYKRRDMAAEQPPKEAEYFTDGRVNFTTGDNAADVQVEVGEDE